MKSKQGRGRYKPHDVQRRRGVVSVYACTSMKLENLSILYVGFDGWRTQTNRGVAWVAVRIPGIPVLACAVAILLDEARPPKPPHLTVYNHQKCLCNTQITPNPELLIADVRIFGSLLRPHPPCDLAVVSRFHD